MGLEGLRLEQGGVTREVEVEARAENSQVRDLVE